MMVVYDSAVKYRLRNRFGKPRRVSLALTGGTDFGDLKTPWKKEIGGSYENGKEVRLLDATVARSMRCVLGCHDNAG
jgi:hypothetical protein